MQVCVETCDGCQLPPGCHVGIRVGEMLKQGKYEPHRSYHFPPTDRRRHAKIDIFQHVGSCTVTVDPEVTAMQEVGVQLNDTSMPAVRLKVRSEGKLDDPQKEAHKAKAQALKSNAKGYLQKYNIEEKLEEAVKALLREQPGDPMAFLCKLLGGDQGTAEAPAKAVEDLAQLRRQACAVLNGAIADGRLRQVLDDLQGSVGPPGETARVRMREGLVQASVDGRLKQALMESIAEEQRRSAGASTSVKSPGAVAQLAQPSPAAPTAPAEALPAMMVNGMTVLGGRALRMGMAQRLVFF